MKNHRFVLVASTMFSFQIWYLMVYSNKINGSMYYNLAGTVDSLIRKDMLESILILNIAVVKLASTPRFDFNAVTAGAAYN